MKVAIIDYGAGNIRSVCNAISFIGCDYLLSGDKKELKDSSHIILPGVGSFRGVMSALQEGGLVDILNELVLTQGCFFLGICAGMQILANKGDEFGSSEGLGWINGATKRLTVEQYGLHLPHVGWNDIVGNLNQSKLFSDTSIDPTFYFVNSYSLKVYEEVDSIGHTYYGEKFVSMVEKNNIFGVQFHPEKSQDAGLQLLKNFVSL